MNGWRVYKERLKKLINYRISLNNTKKAFAFLSVVFILLLSLSSSLIHQFRVENVQLKNQLSAVGEELTSTREALAEEILTLEKKANTDNIKDPYEQNKMSLNICGGNIGLYETNKYTVSYDFPKGVTTFKIIFTDSTGNLEINLMERITGDSNIYEGDVSVDLFWEGEQGRDKLSIYVFAREKGKGNVKGPESELLCTYNAYNKNLNYEGNERIEHIRSPLVEDGFFNLTTQISGIVWQQTDLYDSLEECAEDSWIQESYVDDWNEYNREEGEEELTAEKFCLSEVGTYTTNKVWDSSFRYPIINIENADKYVGPWDSKITDLSAYKECIDTINNEMESYATNHVSTFSEEIDWLDHWGTTLQGDYRLVGLNVADEDSSSIFEFSSWQDGIDPYSYDNSNKWDDNKQYMGHRNNLPKDDFDLSEYGLVKEEVPHFISFIYEIYSYTGGNHGMYTYQTFNYDLRTCKEIQLKDMMSDEILKEQGFELPKGADSLWLNLLATRLSDIWSVDQGQLPGFEDWSAAPWKSLDGGAGKNDTFDALWPSSLDYSHLQAVSINNNGLTFSFQPYAVDCWACGWPELTIAWGNLWDIFKWGNWDEVDEFVIYEDTIIYDEPSYLLNLEQISQRLVESYEFNDLILGLTHIYRADGFGNDSDWIQSPIHKQSAGITYGFVGDYTKKDEYLLKSFVYTMNTIIGREEFKFTTNEEEITLPVKFMKCLDKRPYGDFWNTGSCSGYNGIYYPIDNYIRIDADLYGLERDRVLIHELGHSIGLNHSACLSNGLMSLKNKNKETTLNFSDFEIAMIRFLYSQPIYSVGNIGTYEKILEVGMSYEEIISFTGSISQPLTQESQFCPDEIETYIPEEGDG